MQLRNPMGGVSIQKDDFACDPRGINGRASPGTHSVVLFSWPTCSARPWNGWSQRAGFGRSGAQLLEEVRAEISKHGCDLAQQRKVRRPSSVASCVRRPAPVVTPATTRLELPHDSGSRKACNIRCQPFSLAITENKLIPVFRARAAEVGLGSSPHLRGFPLLVMTASAGLHKE